MRLKESVEEGIEIFALDGEIDFQHAPSLRSRLQAKVKAQLPALVLDLTKVDYIDSTGLALIIEYFRDAAKQGGLLCLAGLNQTLRSIFEIVQLDKTIPMFQDKAAALAAIHAGTIRPPSPSFFDRPAA